MFGEFTEIQFLVRDWHIKLQDGTIARIGDVVRHKLTNQRLLVIGPAYKIVDRNLLGTRQSIVVRTAKLEEIELYPIELKADKKL